jgi:hypothetical protein
MPSDFSRWKHKRCFCTAAFVLGSSAAVISQAAACISDALRQCRGFTCRTQIHNNGPHYHLSSSTRFQIYLVRQIPRRWCLLELVKPSRVETRGRKPGQGVGKPRKTSDYYSKNPRLKDSETSTSFLPITMPQQKYPAKSLQNLRRTHAALAFAQPVDTVALNIPNFEDVRGRM